MTAKPRRVISSALLLRSILCLFFLLPLTLLTRAFSQEQRGAPREYLSQNVIDSLANRGFYVLTEGSSVAGYSFMQEKAIIEAKNIVRKLRKLAEGDPNRKYILWKVSELEQQIALEEHEVLRIKNQKKQKIINHLVDQFNAEIGRRRPDFQTLDAYRGQMHTVDPGKADELLWYIQDRANAIARELVRKIEHSLETGKLDRARRELDYCNRNDAYLKVPMAVYGRLAGKLRALVDLGKERTAIIASLKRAETLLKQDSLGQAWSEATDARSRLSAVKFSLPRGEWGRYAVHADRIIGTVEQKEDRLVQRNLRLLKEKGIDAAIEFHGVLKKHRVSRQKTVMVNNEIIETILTSRTVEDTAISEELTELMKEEEGDRLDMDQMAAAAKKLAKEKADSIRAAQEKKPSWFASLFGAGKTQKKSDQPRANSQPEQQVVSRSSTSNTPIASEAQSHAALPVSNAPSAGGQSSSGQSLNPQETTEQMIQIYTLLEQDEIQQAKSKFVENRESFQTHLIPEAYAALQAALHTFTEQSAAP